jgi:ribosomal protein S27E
MSIIQNSINKEAPKAPQRLAEKCPECASKNLVHDYDSGETICGDCGLVLYEQMMDKGPEWRAFTQQEKASRSRVLFMIKAYPRPSVKLTGMHSGESCPYPQDYRCGVLGNGKSAAECIHLSTVTLLKP